jgi:hypothetical protein
MATPTFSVDDCGYQKDCYGWGIRWRPFELIRSFVADLTVFSWLFLVAYCVFVVFSMYAGRWRILVDSDADWTLIVSVHGGGYHLWEVTHDELVRFKKVRATSLRMLLETH